MAEHLGIGGIGGITRTAARFRRARIVLGSALVAATAVLAAGWPAETHADGLYETLELQQANDDDRFANGATELGSLLAVTRLVADDKRPGRFYLEILVRNKTSEGAESAQIEVGLERTAYSPMSRGAPPPTVVWKTKEIFRVPAGETLTKRFSLPAGLSARIRQAQKPPQADDRGIPTGPVVEYATNIVQMVPAGAGAPAPSEPAAGSTKAVVASVSPAGGGARQASDVIVW
jgi:hypothetical protein